jgi:hypothetical protein
MTFYSNFGYKNAIKKNIIHVIMDSSDGGTIVYTNAYRQTHRHPDSGKTSV